MTENYKKNVTSLSDHILQKKRGILATPLMNGLGKQLKLSSWTKERMPEYLWLGLILMYYGREEEFKKTGEILFQISKKINNLSTPKLSMIFNLSNEDQKIIYEIITNNIDKKVLFPLTVIYHYTKYPLFNEYFNIPYIGFETRLAQLSKAIKTYYPPQADETTDLRYLALSLLLFGGKLHIAKQSKVTAKALSEYPYTKHTDVKMRKYRPTIRSMEVIDLGEKNIEFYSNFWRDIGMITSCKPMCIVFDQNEEEYKEFISNFQKTLEYILHSNKEKSLTDDRFDVIIGSINYALKIFIEINEQSLGNCILGRHGLRTIIEVFIILKYLISRETENTNIWEEYKLYGINKYKLVLLKARETELDKSSHFQLPIVDMLVNEIKWEEFIDIDFKYFDKLGIREKSIEVGEKDLYDLFYDYDSSFSHGLWGAVRESTMLNCDNAGHRYHSIPDIYSEQKLADIKTDSFNIMNRLYSLLVANYGVPVNMKEGCRIDK